VTPCSSPVTRLPRTPSADRYDGREDHSVHRVLRPRPLASSASARRSVTGSGGEGMPPRLRDLLPCRVSPQDEANVLLGTVRLARLPPVPRTSSRLARRLRLDDTDDPVKIDHDEVGALIPAVRRDNALPTAYWHGRRMFPRSPPALYARLARLSLPTGRGPRNENRPVHLVKAGPFLMTGYLGWLRRPGRRGPNGMPVPPALRPPRAQSVPSACTSCSSGTGRTAPPAACPAGALLAPARWPAPSSGAIEESAAARSPRRSEARGGRCRPSGVEVLAVVP